VGAPADVLWPAWVRALVGFGLSFSSLPLIGELNVILGAFAAAVGAALCVSAWRLARGMRVIEALFLLCSLAIVAWECTVGIVELLRD
jgi:hypothetical protein